MAAYEVLLLNTAIPQIQAAQSGDTYVVPRDIAFSTVASFAAGAEATPSIVATGDTNTGIWFPAADTVAISTGGISRMRLDSSGNLGLGVTPSAWTSGWKAMQIGVAQGFADAGNGYNFYFSNAFNSSTGEKYITANPASVYRQGGGEHAWFRSTSTPVIGNDPVFSQAMTLDASGNLGIGVTSIGAIGSSKLVEIGATTGNSAFLLFNINNARTGAMYSNASETSVGSISATPLLLKTGDTEKARISSDGTFRVKGAGTAGSTDAFQVAGTAPADAARIDSSGNLLIGSTTNTTVSNLILNGATRWAVGTQSGGNLFYIVRDSDNVGQYMVNGSTSWTATSDERLKDIIEPITDAANKVLTLRAVIGKFKKDTEGTRRSFLIAQDVQAVLPEAVTVQEDEFKTLGIQYTEVIPLLVAAIQEQQTLITALTARITALESSTLQ